MVFSLLFIAVAFLLGISTTFAGTPYSDAGEPYSDPCNAELSYTHIINHPLSNYNYSIYTVSSGDLCCKLCHNSELNCVVAQWQKNTFQCMVVMNEKNLGTDKTATCPNGRFSTGLVGGAIGAMNGWIPGPCWLPKGIVDNGDRGR